MENAGSVGRRRDGTCRHDMVGMEGCGFTLTKEREGMRSVGVLSGGCSKVHKKSGEVGR